MSEKKDAAIMIPALDPNAAAIRFLFVFFIK